MYIYVRRDERERWKFSSSIELQKTKEEEAESWRKSGVKRKDRIWEIWLFSCIFPSFSRNSLFPFLFSAKTNKGNSSFLSISFPFLRNPLNHAAPNYWILQEINHLYIEILIVINEKYTTPSFHKSIQNRSLTQFLTYYYNIFWKLHCSL